MLWLYNLGKPSKIQSSIVLYRFGGKCFNRIDKVACSLRNVETKGDRSGVNESSLAMSVIPQKNLNTNSNAVEPPTLKQMKYLGNARRKVVGGGRDRMSI